MCIRRACRRATCVITAYGAAGAPWALSPLPYAASGITGSLDDSWRYPSSNSGCVACVGGADPYVSFGIAAGLDLTYVGMSYSSPSSTGLDLTYVGMSYSSPSPTGLDLTYVGMSYSSPSSVDAVTTLRGPDATTALDLPPVRKAGVARIDYDFMCQSA